MQIKKQAAQLDVMKKHRLKKVGYWLGICKKKKKRTKNVSER